MAYVINTGMGAMPSQLRRAMQARKDIAAIAKAPVEKRQEVARRLAEKRGRTPITREQITEPYKVRSTVRSRSAPSPPPPSIAPIPSAAPEAPLTPQLPMEAPKETDYTWYYVGGGVALLALGAAAYFVWK